MHLHMTQDTDNFFDENHFYSVNYKYENHVLYIGIKYMKEKITYLIIISISLLYPFRFYNMFILLGKTVN